MAAATQAKLVPQQQLCVGLLPCCHHLLFDAGWISQFVDQAVKMCVIVLVYLA
jgi:hypothetical protein